MNQDKPCGCSAYEDVGINFAIVYCPTHAMAPEMADLIRFMVANYGRTVERESWEVRARTLLTRIEGKS